MNVAVGDTAEITRTITEDDLQSFGLLVGDLNPVHFDDEFAAKTRFGRRIVHGMWGAALISAVLGTRLPGPGTVYLSQSLRFRAPVHPGDTVTTRVTILTIHETKPIYTLETVCENEEGELLLDGEAVVLLENVG